MDGWERSFPDRGPEAGTRPVWGGGPQEDMRSERELGHSVGGPISILRTLALLGVETQGTAGDVVWSGVQNALRGQNVREPSYKAGSKLGTQGFVLNPGVFPRT